ncbi:MAG TPA: AAA family ATPase [Candidatus Nanoarchaeia archaeon]|nr:AAA family ATPase [Candidatus Nanoarchaeia archaeon]
MKTISLIGSHGTGKTTIFDKIKEQRPELRYFRESVREFVPALGYASPWDLVREFGIGPFELMNMNSWAVMDPAQNSLLQQNDTIVTDRSAIDNFAYYLTLCTGQTDFDVEELLKRMGQYYASLTTKFVYFPIGAIPLKGDDMRPSDSDLQRRVDENISRAFRILRVPEQKVHLLKSTTIDGRTKEVLEVIAKC